MNEDPLIADHVLIGDLQTAALIATQPGPIDLPATLVPGQPEAPRT